MTPPSPAALEALLQAAYREEAEYYGQAITLCQQHLAAPQTPADGWLPQLLSALERVAAVEARIATAKADWQRSGRTPGPALASSLRQIAEQLRVLAAAVDGVMASLEALRLKLPEKLAALSHARRVHGAYQRVAARIMHD